LADNYKHRAIELYNPHIAPFLDHYRWALSTIFRYFRLFWWSSGCVFRNMELGLSFSILHCSYSRSSYAFSVSGTSWPKRSNLNVP
jgi:hypothetical protein